MSRLAREVEACAKCGLAAGRTRVVVGEGCLEGGVVLVGEAPGRREDEAGRPFVGYAGRVLDQLLEEAGLSRLEVYITNLVKCRPPGNRRPRKGEVQACSGYLERQLRILEPKVVATLGKVDPPTHRKDPRQASTRGGGVGHSLPPTPIPPSCSHLQQVS